MKYQPMRILLFSAFILSTFWAYSQSVVTNINGFQPALTSNLNELFCWSQFQVIGQEGSQVSLIAELRYADGTSITRVYGNANLQPGANSCERVTIVRREDTDALFAQWVNQNGALPSGDYQLCITVTEAGGGTETVCEVFNANEQTGLQLIYPYDEEEVYTERPFLNWQYLGAGNMVEYTITLKEKKSGQGNRQAMEMNPVLFHIEHHPSMVLDYPMHIENLQRDKHYVWQVEAWFNGKRLIRSEIWSFYLVEPVDISTLPITDSYIDLDRVEGQPTFYLLGAIRLKKSGATKAGEIRVELRNEKGKKVKLNENETLEVNLGDNYYEINLQEGARLKHMRNYQVILRSPLLEKGKINYDFIYLNPDYVTNNK